MTVHQTAQQSESAQSLRTAGASVLRSGTSSDTICCTASTRTETNRTPSPRLRCPSAFRLPSAVRIVEVGPRDGLQNETCILPAADKVALIHELADANLPVVEVTSFVSAKRVPQLADAVQVMSAVRRRRGTSYPALVPNARGLRDALAAGARDLAIFVAASEPFSKANLNCGVRESLKRFRPIVAAARSAGVQVRAYISCVVECPYSGVVDPSFVADVAVALRDMGCFELSLGDTIGAGNPRTIVKVIDAILSQGVPVDMLAIHCHDTRGTALANVLAAMSRGVSVVDSSIAGLGGCPFAPGATGNLATEDLVHMLQGMAIDIGPIRLEELIEIGERICRKLGRPTSSRVAQAASNSITAGKLGTGSEKLDV